MAVVRMGRAGHTETQNTVHRTELGHKLEDPMLPRQDQSSNTLVFGGAAVQQDLICQVHSRSWILACGIDRFLPVPIQNIGFCVL